MARLVLLLCRREWLLAFVFMIGLVLTTEAQEPGQQVQQPPAQVHKRFEYKYSFKPPYLAQKDGTVPFFEYSGSKYSPLPALCPQGRLLPRYLLRLAVLCSPCSSKLKLLASLALPSIILPRSVVLYYDTFVLKAQAPLLMSSVHCLSL